jgi:glycosyltransferase involved in cell wall biosynthesis
VILGSWSSPIAHKTLLITTLLRIPFLMWADHPYPGQRTLLFDLCRKQYLRWLGRRAAGFLACGSPTVSELTRLGIAPAKITNFPYWVAVPGEWSLPNGCRVDQENKPLRLIAIGRHVRVKAFEIAIEGVALANRCAGDTVATLNLVGDGPERNNLVSLVKRMKLDDVVKFSGWVENDLVWEEIRQADALIIPSRFEPYGVVVLEAMAQGRPVLASDKVIAAVDRDNGQGAIFFHPPGEAEPLARQMTMLARDRNILKASSLAARAIAEAWAPRRAATILRTVLETPAECGSNFQKGRSGGLSSNTEEPRGADKLCNNVLTPRV